MPSDMPLSTLRRMAGARPDAEVAAASGAPALERALASAAIRAADAMSGLGLQVGDRAARRVDAAEAFAGLDARALCLLVDPVGLGADAIEAMEPEVLSAATGVLVFHPGLVDALIEVQTIGRVDGPARAARRPTRIDAALAQPFAREVLKQATRQLPDGDTDPCPGRLRSGSFVAGPDPLAMLLTAPRMIRLDLTLTLGDGAREATMTLILPQHANSAATAPMGDPLQATAPAAEAAAPESTWEERLTAAAMDAPVRLEALLPPLRLPLSRLMTLKVGDLIELDATALSDITLHGGSSGLTMPGRKRPRRGAALTARLGQLNGARAVKISTLPGERGGASDADTAPATDGFGAALADMAPAGSPAAYSAPKAPPVPATADLDLSELDLADLPDLP